MFRIGRVGGIDIKLHWSLLVMFGLIALGAVSLANQYGTRPAMLQVTVFVGIFLTILLHELGHAVTAIRFGGTVSDIILSPIGGIARIGRLRERPVPEFLVAIAGPAVNVVLFLIAWMILGSVDGMFLVANEAVSNLLQPRAPSPDQLLIPGSVLDVVTILGGVNILVAGFNMIPGFPMDGGRVLRALLASRMDYLRATQIAASLGRVLALGLVAWGVYMLFGYSQGSGLILAVIGVFLLLAGTMELMAVRTRSIVRGLRAHQALDPAVPRLHPNQPMFEAITRLQPWSGTLAPVIDDEGYLVGGVTAASTRSAPPYGSVREWMKPRVRWVAPEDALDEIVRAMQERPISIVPVTLPDGRYVGSITATYLQELIRERAKAAGHTGPLPPTFGPPPSRS